MAASPRTIAVEDVDTRWPYRAGYPRLLRPRVESRPVKKADFPISEANFEKLIQLIDEIAEAHSITLHDGSFIRTPPRMEYRAHSSPVSQADRQQIRVVVRCVYEKGLSHSKTWAKAVTEIYEEANMLCEPAREIGVELFDYKYMDTYRFGPCPSKERAEMSMNWNMGQNYRQRILQLFENRSHMWQVMVPIGLWAEGSRSQDHKMVIYFDALDAEDDVWDELEEAIRSILPEDIGVAILQSTGPLLRFGNNMAKLKPVFVAGKYTRPPMPGCEISIEQNKLSAGTMGGYVITEAKDTRIRTTFGITNAHVVYGKREEATFNAQTGDSIVIQSPGEETRRKNEIELRTAIQKYEHEISGQADIIEAVKESDPALAQRLDKQLKVYQSTASELKDSLQLAVRDACIGSVQVAKLGYRDYENSSSASSDSKRTQMMVDFALIRMYSLSRKHPREIFFKENEERPQIPANRTYNSWEVDSLGKVMDAGKRISVVAKLSRRGNYAMGHLDEFEADIKPELYENGDKIVRKRSAYVISTSSVEDGISDLTKPGDSGSLIIAAHGWEFAGYDNRVAMPRTLNACAAKPFVVGLLFGDTDGGRVTYFIPFDVVKSEIEALTGEEMVWPPKRSTCIQRWEEGHTDDEL